MALLNSPLQRGYCKGMTINNIAMPLDPATGLCRGGVLFKDWHPQQYYSYAGNVREVVVTTCDLRTKSFFVTLMIFVSWNMHLCAYLHTCIIANQQNLNQT